MYAVVEFTESAEVEVVPCTWLSLDHKVSFWPPYKDTNRIKVALVQRAEPDETWGEFFVRVIKMYGETDKSRIYHFSPHWLYKFWLTLLFSSIDTYEAARKRLKRAETKSSLTSEEEGGKRRRM